MKFQFTPQGVCTRQIDFEIEDGRVRNIAFHGGCTGNLKAICKLLDGMRPEEVVAKLKGNTCGNNPTSCADQLAQALEAAVQRS